jgi:hypothetical protein
VVVYQWQLLWLLPASASACSHRMMHMLPADAIGPVLLSRVPSCSTAQAVYISTADRAHSCCPCFAAAVLVLL